MTVADRFPRLAVFGLGYMGGSLAAAARRAGMVDRVVGFDPSAEAGQTALARGIVDELASSPDAAARGASLAVLAGPVRTLGDTARAIAAALPADAFVLDIGSVKQPVVAAVEATALAGRFVGCHPLAGAELSGTAAADADLYTGRACFVCPGPCATPAALAAVRRFWEGIGSSVLTLDPEAHDVFMAAASHLPHVAAFTLAASLTEVAAMIEERTPPSAPPTSLRDTTRVAASNPVIWRDIFLANRGHLLPLIDRLEGRLADLRRALQTEDVAALEALLTAGRACRQRVVKP